MSKLVNGISWEDTVKKEEVLLVLKKGWDVSAFRKALDRVVGKRAEIAAVVSKRSLEIRDLDETVEKEEVVVILCLALGRLVFDGSCRLFTRFSGMKAAVIQLTEADAARLLLLGQLRIGWVECCIREYAEVARCFRRLGYSRRSRGCGNPGKRRCLLEVRRHRAYLRRFKKRDEETCCYCDSPVDNAEHSLFVCTTWGVAREAIGRAVDAELTPETMVSLMFQSEQFWILIESFVTVSPDFKRERYAHNANSSTYVRMVARAA